MSKVVFVQDIDVQGSPKVRAAMSDQTIAEYAAVYRADKKALPPIVLFTEDNHRYLLADGAHRLAAMISCKVNTIIAVVNRGGYEAALSCALTANERHGLRRSREDKRQSVTTALKLWANLSNVQIAQRCMVDDKTVQSVRDELEREADIKTERKRVDSSGRVQTAKKPRPEAKEKACSEIRAPKEEPVVEEVPTDPTGRPIPKFCMNYWRRADEVKELLGHIGHVMTALKQANRDSDTMFAGVNITGVLADLDKSWTSIQTAIPYVVCTQCQGHPNKQPKGECRLCKNKGLISKFLWDTVVPTEVKTVLKNQHK